MTGYTRKWDCPKCGTGVEGIDWPLDGDDLCERCKERGVKLSAALTAFCEAYGDGCSWPDVPSLIAAAAAAGGDGEVEEASVRAEAAEARVKELEDALRESNDLLRGFMRELEDEPRFRGMVLAADTIVREHAPRSVLPPVPGEEPG